MLPVSYACHQFPPEVIQHAVWLCLRFTLSFRDVEDLLAERGLDIPYETARRWVLKFGPATARRVRRRRPKPSPRWHLDEVLILSANSGCRCQSCKTCHARLGPRQTVEPSHHA